MEWISKPKRPPNVLEGNCATQVQYIPLGITESSQSMDISVMRSVKKKIETTHYVVVPNLKTWDHVEEKPIINGHREAKHLPIGPNDQFGVFHTYLRELPDVSVVGGDLDTVINGYVVLTFGYSDRRDHFFTLVYFCTSQKRAIYIDWYIRFTMFECWFHVTKIMCKRAQEFKADASDTRSVLLTCKICTTIGSDYVVNLSMRKSTEHIIKRWVNTHQFSHWQIFCTPSGYQPTINPWNSTTGL
ncbi:hypothetical protein PHMEG_00018038 [Phytophthora megakarya]|uniref:Uncharacterized protein n=1 Tax=Phytophthora megakarya TaxID=4795 RepID=A0A225VWV5_9STRA|nr:hypothetical protein PHMEG_00018038 [Phytophthora megakarya]